MANLATTNFYFVTKPTRNSTLGDVLMDRTIGGSSIAGNTMDYQFLGGLRSDEILGMFDNEADAQAFAVDALARAGAVCQFCNEGNLIASFCSHCGDNLCAKCDRIHTPEACREVSADA
jgi:hypothetical protein